MKEREGEPHSVDWYVGQSQMYYSLISGRGLEGWGLHKLSIV